MITNLYQPESDSPLPLEGKRVLIITEKWYEDLELWYTRIRLVEAGAVVEVASTDLEERKGYYGLGVKPNLTFKDVDPDGFDGIVIPGGYAPDFLRRDRLVLELVDYFNQQKKLIAFICHGGWVPISAKIVKGRRSTGLIAIKDDLINAGAEWIQDDPVVVDGNLISSRRPDDLPCFCFEIIKFLSTKKR